MSSPRSTRRPSTNGGPSTFVADAPRATGVGFTRDALVVRLADGRELSVPLSRLPRLRQASRTQRRDYELVDDGQEIRWPALDEDLSVAGLLGLPD